MPKRKGVFGFTHLFPTAVYIVWYCGVKVQLGPIDVEQEKQEALHVEDSPSPMYIIEHLLFPTEENCF